MSENKHLTPVWIIYVDGRRLDTEYEGALRSITVTDRLNGVSSFSVVFDTSEVKVREKNLISHGSEISIHLGYKDDVEEVFSGDVLGFLGIFPEAGTEQLVVSGRSVLQRLNRGARARSFEKKTASDVITGIIDGYSLKAEVEAFGAARDFQTEEDQTDLDYILMLAEAYGKQVYAYGSTIYVKSEVSVRSDEIIYEWGKSLISLEAAQNSHDLLSEVDFLGWDNLKSESFAGKAVLKDIPVKIGGGKDWSKITIGGNVEYADTKPDLNSRDRDEAKQLALGLLQNNSYSFGYAEGKGEGNYRLRPGMRVTVKMVGERFEGEYTASTVTHRFDMRSGYITEFTLKRNMCG